MASRSKKTLQPNLFSLDNPPVKMAPAPNARVDGYQNVITGLGIPESEKNRPLPEDGEIRWVVDRFVKFECSATGLLPNPPVRLVEKSSGAGIASTRPLDPQTQTEGESAGGLNNEGVRPLHTLTQPPSQRAGGREPLCAWCSDYSSERGHQGLCACTTEDIERSPNSDPSSLVGKHPYKGKGVEKGEAMAPNRWKGKG